MSSKLYRIASNLSDVSPTDSLYQIYLNLMKSYDANREYFIRFGARDMLCILIYIYSIKNNKGKDWADNIIKNSLIISTFHYEEDEFESEECDDCNGRGDINCEGCDGTGLVDCDNCNGEGQISCSKCDGEGEDSEGNRCDECDGDGEEECDDCNGEGKETCNVCSGNGSESCESCDGRGTVDSSRNLLRFNIYLSFNLSINKQLYNALEIGNPLEFQPDEFDDVVLLWTGEEGMEMTGDSEVLESDNTYCNMIEPLITSELRFSGTDKHRTITLFDIEVPERFLID